MPPFRNGSVEIDSKVSLVKADLMKTAKQLGMSSRTGLGLAFIQTLTESDVTFFYGSNITAKMIAEANEGEGISPTNGQPVTMTTTAVVGLPTSQPVEQNGTQHTTSSRNPLGLLPSTQAATPKPTAIQQSAISTDPDPGVTETSAHPSSQTFTNTQQPTTNTQITSASASPASAPPASAPPASAQTVTSGTTPSVTPATQAATTPDNSVASVPVTTSP